MLNEKTIFNIKKERKTKTKMKTKMKMKMKTKTKMKTKMKMKMKMKIKTLGILRVSNFRFIKCLLIKLINYIFHLIFKRSTSSTITKR